MNEYMSHMKVENYIAYRIIGDLDFEVGKYLYSKPEYKIQMEDELERVRQERCPHLPSRRLAMYVIPSEEFEQDWAVRLFQPVTGYYWLKLSLTGDLFWFNSDLLTLSMTEEKAVEYWGSELTDPYMKKDFVVPEGLFIGTAVIEEVTYKCFEE